MGRARWVLTLLAALVLAPVPFMATAAPASACSCAIGAPEEFIEHADVIVVGTLTGIDPTGGSSSADPIWYELDVEQVFEGTATQRLRFSSAASGASCGLENMQTGVRYLVFLTGVTGSLSANLCGGTQPVEGADDVLDAVTALGASPPEPGGPPPMGEGESGVPRALTIAGLAALVVIAVWWAVIGRRRIGRPRTTPG